MNTSASIEKNNANYKGTKSWKKKFCLVQFRKKLKIHLEVYRQKDPQRAKQKNEHSILLAKSQPKFRKFLTKYYWLGKPAL